MSHVSHMCESYIYTRWKSRNWVMSHTCNDSIPPLRTSLVAHKNESCPTYVWAFHIYAITAYDYHVSASCHTREILNVALKSESCRLYEWVMSQMCMGHTRVGRGYRMNASCRHIQYEMISSCQHIKYEMSPVWMSHVANLNESCPTHVWVIDMCVVTTAWMRHVTYMKYEMSPTWMSHVPHTSE